MSEKTRARFLQRSHAGELALASSRGQGFTSEEKSCDLPDAGGLLAAGPLGQVNKHFSLYCGQRAAASGKLMQSWPGTGLEVKLLS